MQNLIGFESTRLNLLNSYNQQKLHHAILIHGKKGIGKARFAKNFAKEILENHNINNPDLFIIEKEEGKKEISVNQIRKIANFSNQTSAISKNKVIIIDSACNLNKSSSNALLKILEEPHKNNFLILISHNLNAVLPTIKSRCQLVKIEDLTKENFRKILLQENSTFEEDNLNFLSEICDNSPANALKNGGELTKTYKLFLSSLENRIILDDFLKLISDKNYSFESFEKSYLFFANRLVKFFNCLKIDFYFNEEEIFVTLMKKSSLDKIFKIIEKSSDLISKTNSLNLDKKLTITNIFNFLVR